MSSGLRRLLSSLAGLALGISLCYVAGLSGLRWDLTGDQRHSLSSSSQEFLTSLQNPVTVRYYVSRSGNEMPVRLRGYAEQVDQLLQEIESVSEGKVVLEWLDPLPNSAAEESAQIDGVQAQTIGDDSQIYLGLAFSSGDRSEALPVLDPTRRGALEYEVLSKLQDVSRAQKTGLGLVSSLPIAEKGREWQLVRELSESYDVFPLGGAMQIPKAVEILMVVHPRSVSTAFDKRVDEFMNRGGKLLVLMDSLSLALSFSGTTSRVADLTSEWAGLTRASGLSFTGDQLVTDMTFSTGLNRGEGFEEINSILSITPEGISKDHEVTDGLSKLSFQMSGAFTGTAVEGLEMVPLVTSTSDSALQAAELILTASKTETARMHSAFSADSEMYNLALLLKGGLRSFATGETIGVDGRMVLIGDADFIADPYSGNLQEVQGEQQFVPINDNHALVRNALSWLENDTLLNEARTRSRTSRPLTKLTQMERNSQARFETKLSQLQEELNAQEGVQSLEGVMGGTTKPENVSLNYQKVRMQQDGRTAQIRADVRKLKRAKRIAVANLRTRIQWVTVLSVPIAIVLTGASFLFVRNRRTRAL